MTGLIITADADTPWRQPTDWPGKAAPGDPSLKYKSLMDRRPGLPNVQRVAYEPNHFEPPHSHDEDEVIYIMGGDMSLGARTVAAGDTIYVALDTRYSFRAGPAGCEFVRLGLPV
jgi:quercetin dioxygenase-like cupin family protein